MSDSRRNPKGRAGLLRSILFSALIVAAAGGAEQQPQGFKTFQGEGVERFLREADITELRGNLTGNTSPRKATLELNPSSAVQKSKFR